MRPPNLPRIARVLFYLSAVIWVGFGIFTLAGLDTWSGAQAMVMKLVSVLMLGNAVILAWFGWMVGSETPRYPRLASLYVFLNLVLSITDQFGLYDFISLAYNLILLAVCLRLIWLTNRRTP